MTDKRTKHQECGASLFEYVILMSLICMVCIIAVKTLGQQVAMKFEDATDEFVAAAGGYNPG
ncbi:Flp family type IVb pilin [Pirellulaceae bacterium SH449]